MFANTTERSLFLIDEFGKGTNKNDGIAVAAATLQSFLDMTTPPKVRSSTSPPQSTSDLDDGAGVHFLWPLLLALL